MCIVSAMSLMYFLMYLGRSSCGVILGVVTESLPQNIGAVWRGVRGRSGGGSASKMSPARVDPPLNPCANDTKGGADPHLKLNNAAYAPTPRGEFECCAGGVDSAVASARSSYTLLGE